MGPLLVASFPVAVVAAAIAVLLPLVVVAAANEGVAVAIVLPPLGHALSPGGAVGLVSREWARSVSPGAVAP